MATEDGCPSACSFISKAVSPALDELHLAMEAFGDAVAIREDEQAQDLLLSCLQSFSEGSEEIEAAGFQLSDQFHEEAKDAFLQESLAAFVAGYQEALRFLLEQIQLVDGGLFLEIGL